MLSLLNQKDLTVLHNSNPKRYYILPKVVYKCICAIALAFAYTVFDIYKCQQAFANFLKRKQKHSPTSFSQITSGNVRKQKHSPTSYLQITSGNVRKQKHSPTSFLQITSGNVRKLCLLLPFCAYLLFSLQRNQC